MLYNEDLQFILENWACRLPRCFQQHTGPNQSDPWTESMRANNERHTASHSIADILPSNRHFSNDFKGHQISAVAGGTTLMSCKSIQTPLFLRFLTLQNLFI
ncbi:hypothetical protein ILYODFUR_019761 [Ilyodon furcidens]|uniref:Uncharacterized protein n=1 Tax=Ilyodon furcidens TaxID=33524 RepID=A0ABV0SMN8_9TELE